MNRGTFLAAALVTAMVASAADQPTEGTAKKTSTKNSTSAPAKPSTKASKDKASASKASPSSKGGSAATSPAADPAKVAEVFRAKSNFLFAVDSCERPDRCDKALRADAEERFMKGCLECAPQERCEADRQTIRDGNGKRSYNPCSSP